MHQLVMVRTLSGGGPGTWLRGSESCSRSVRDLDIETCGVDSSNQGYWCLKRGTKRDNACGICLVKAACHHGKWPSVEDLVMDRNSSRWLARRVSSAVEEFWFKCLGCYEVGEGQKLILATNSRVVMSIRA